MISERQLESPRAIVALRVGSDIVVWVEYYEPYLGLPPTGSVRYSL